MNIQEQLVLLEEEEKEEEEDLLPLEREFRRNVITLEID